MSVTTKGILYIICKQFNLLQKTVIDRLKLQKTIYLLEAYGMQLGYGFSWYKYGPYSRDLVDDAYIVLRSEKSEYEKMTDSWRFSDKTNQKIKDFKESFSPVLNNLNQLELVASVDFVCFTWHPEADKDTIINIFKKHKTKLLDKTTIKNSQIKKAFEFSKKLR